MDTRAILVMVGLAVVFAGVVCCTVGLATPYWVVLNVDKTNLGLFELCLEGECRSFSDWSRIYGVGKVGTSSAIKRTMGALFVGVILAGVGIAVGVIHLLIRLRGTKSWNFIIFAVVACLIAGISVIFGVITFSTVDRLRDHRDDFGVSYYASMAGGIAMLIGGFMLLTGIQKIKTLTINSGRAGEMALPQHNVIAMQNVSVYGYDQEQFSPSPASYPSPSYHIEYFQRQ